MYAEPRQGLLAVEEDNGGEPDEQPDGKG